MSWTVIRPIGARVLFKLDRKREMYGSVAIPDTAQRQQETGVVLAIGSRVQGIEVGDVLLTGKWNGHPLAAPEWDADGAERYWMLRAPRSDDRGDKLAVPVYGRTHLPVADQIYGKIEGMSEDERIRRFWR